MRRRLVPSLEDAISYFIQDKYLGVDVLPDIDFRNLIYEMAKWQGDEFVMSSGPYSELRIVWENDPDERSLREQEQPP